LLRSAIPCMDAQAAVWRNDSPPGPRASATRNKSYGRNWVMAV
jgi:hypothetical protein